MGSTTFKGTFWVVMHTNGYKIWGKGQFGWSEMASKIPSAVKFSERLPAVPGLLSIGCFTPGGTSQNRPRPIAIGN